MDLALHLRYLVSAILIAVAVGLQFVPLYRGRLTPHADRLWVRVLCSRVFQLLAGFVLLTAGIELMRFQT